MQNMIKTSLVLCLKGQSWQSYHYHSKHSYKFLRKNKYQIEKKWQQQTIDKRKTIGDQKKYNKSQSLY